MFGIAGSTTPAVSPREAAAGNARGARCCIAVLAIVSASASQVCAQVVIPAPAQECRCVCEPAESHAHVQRHTTLRPAAESQSADAGLVIDLHEELLNRIVRRTDQRQSAVRDFVLGADVHGVESTTTTVQIDLRPSVDGVALDLVLSGRNRSHTVGYTPQAAVRTLGQHRFVARKRIVHDGRLFHTARPRVDVSPSNQTLGVDTPVSGMPLLGDVAASIGYQAAEARRPQGEMIAAQKIRDGVGTEFNQQVDSQLARLNAGWIEQVAPRLERVGFADFALTGQSSDEWARYVIDVGSGSRAGQRVRQTAQRVTRVRQPAVRMIAQRTTDGTVGQAAYLGRVSVDDRAINAVLERLDIAGATVRAADFAEPAAVALQVLDTLRDRGLGIAEIPPEAAGALAGLSIRFDERAPLRVAFTRDLIWVRARASVAVPPLIDLPMMQITLRYRIRDAGGGAIVLTPDHLELTAIDPDGPAPGPLAMLLQSQALSALPEITLPREIELPIPDAEPLGLAVESLQSADRRLTLTVR